jgi:hypothetical protein
MAHPWDAVRPMAWRRLPRRVALDSGNWSTDTVNDAFGRAAAVSIGEARATLDRQGEHMRDATAEFPYDIRSRTTVEEMTVRGSGDRRQATVVTRTMVTGGGVRGEGYEYKVASATVDRTEEGWVISRWTLRH